MNKFWKFSGVFAVLAVVVAFGGVTAAFAQGPNQPDSITPPALNQGQNEASTGMGWMAVEETAMHEAIAGALGMSVEAFETEVANGENAFTLAQKLGIDLAVVQEAMDAVHAAALQQAVDDGLLGQEQADWMLSRRGGQGGQGAGMNRGQGGGSAARMGHAGGSYGEQPGDCLYQVP